MNVAELDTPALIVDLDAMDRNLARVAGYAREHSLRLRPHTKTHKTPELARRQIGSGAAGLTVAKVGEAQVMLEADPADLLIAYPIIGEAKLARLASVAKRTQTAVALDSACAARTLAEAAQRFDFEVGVLAEVDVGLRRVGVAPGTELVALVRQIAALPRLNFRGIAFYPGHIKTMDEAGSKALEAVDAAVAEAVAEVERDGHDVEIVSGGSTPALFQSHRVQRLNEIRPGTYIFNDRNTWLTGACNLDDCAASILTTVVSTAVPGQMIIDGGSKTFSSDRCAVAEGVGFGYFPEAPGASLEKMNEEHGFVDIRSAGRSWQVGERVRVIPNHICVAVNLQEKIYGLRGQTVEEVWEVKGRGKLQ
jgi:D-serine deaminase-like pyridoxal phosphate-dependent protein